jgi:Integrase
MPKLTDQQIRTWIARGAGATAGGEADRPKRRLYDLHGLFLLAADGGSRLWRFKYRYAGREKLLALGRYPEVSLAQARVRAADARRQLDEGIDPGQARRQERLRRATLADDTFEAVAREWVTKKVWRPATCTKVEWLLSDMLFPYLGRRPISEIDTPEMLAVLRRMESRGKLETAQRAKQTAGQVFRFAISCGRATQDPTASLRGVLKTPQTRHRAALLEPDRIGGLLRAIEGYGGSLPVFCALRLAPLVFVRPGELRQAEWAEIDLPAAEWRIPAEKMKMNRLHVVPLSRQAVAILGELQPLTGAGRYVFPSTRGRGRPMSENTVNAALRRLGYSTDEVTGHGFRAMARTLLSEQGWRGDVIRRQLSHRSADPLGEAYDRAQFLDERRRMMQAWADYLDALRRGAEVVPLRQRV